MIQPQIQKRAVELEPFIVLVSVLFGGALFGIIGALLAIPVAATIQISSRSGGATASPRRPRLGTAAGARRPRRTATTRRRHPRDHRACAACEHPRA